ncbi:MAG: Dam family site-specific DNA-(adenine-N6)-methyltransferase [Candidatus Thiodiazotropha endolucinida]
MTQVALAEKLIQAKPFVKWAGGKQALAETLVEYFPDDFGTYFEPFIGGGSVFFTLNPKKAVIADYNSWLIDTYNAIKTDWKKVARILDKLPNNKEAYLEIRATLPDKLSAHKKAAHFVYLNKTCFRGLFRVNRKGMFNVPYGDYDRRYYDPANLQQASLRLQETEIRQGDFELNIYGAKKGDFIYFDPPYYKLGGYSDFNRYTDQQFVEHDQIRLAALCSELDRNGVKWALSNSNTDFIKRLYNGFKFYRIAARREINLNSNNRNIKELLITNY